VWLLAAVVVVLATAVVTGAFAGIWSELKAVGFGFWVNLLVAPTIGYLMLSCLTVVFDRPGWWMLGIILLRSVIWNPESSFEPLGDFNIGHALAGQIGRISDPTKPGSPQWWISWPLWVTVLWLLIWGLARTHPDRLRSWLSEVVGRLSRT